MILSNGGNMQLETKALPNKECTRSPAKGAGATLALHDLLWIANAFQKSSAGVVGGTGAARRAGHTHSVLRKRQPLGSTSFIMGKSWS